MFTTLPRKVLPSGGLASEDLWKHHEAHSFLHVLVAVVVIHHFQQQIINIVGAWKPGEQHDEQGSGQIELSTGSLILLSKWHRFVRLIWLPHACSGQDHDLSDETVVGDSNEFHSTALWLLQLMNTACLGLGSIKLLIPPRDVVDRSCRI